MTSKTYRSAVVLIPPKKVCEKIQTIRAQHDKKYRRWMPHITLLYPFKPVETFSEYAPILSNICSKYHPFTITMSEFCFFEHPNNQFTIWLAPKPKETLVQMQSILWRMVPECDDLNKFNTGFTPHLTVAQTDDREKMVSLRKQFQLNWKPIEFEAKSIYLIHRDNPPDDTFKIVEEVSLGKPWNLTPAYLKKFITAKV